MQVSKQELCTLIKLDSDGDNGGSDDEGNELQNPFVASNDGISDLVEDVNNLYSYKAVDVTVKEKVDNMRKKMQFLKLETKDVGTEISIYKKDKRKNVHDDKTSNLGSPFVKREIKGREDAYTFERRQVYGYYKIQKEYLQNGFSGKVHAKQPFSEKKKENLFHGEKKPITAKIFVITGDLCVLTVTADTLKICQIIQFIK